MEIQEEKYSVSEFIEIVVVHWLGITYELLKIIKKRCETEAEEEEIYRFIYSEKNDIEESKTAMMKKLT